MFWWLALVKAVFGSRVLVGDKSQLVFWWLALATRMYQTDYVVDRTCLCYSFHKLLRVPRRCFCCASMFLSFPFRLGRVLFTYVVELFRFVTYLAWGARDPSPFLLLLFFKIFFSLSLCSLCREGGFLEWCVGGSDVPAFCWLSWARTQFS